ncbi:MAG: LytTR family DNA-binding domain-containing protein, partial [Bacteroidota bacterium]
FSLAILVLLVIFAISLIQNVIRYQEHASYNIWTSIIYLCISVLFFIPFMVLSVYVQKKIRLRSKKWYWIINIPLALFVLLVFYLLSGTMLYGLGYFDHFFDLAYARMYFGREALYHLLVLFGSALFVVHTKKKKPKIEVSKGRKVVTIPLDLIYWIEVDDHYLHFHTKTDTFIKRASLSNMAKTLDPDFIRIHRKYLVNRSKIVSMERKQREEFVILVSGKKLKVGQSFMPISW